MPLKSFEQLKWFLHLIDRSKESGPFEEGCDVAGELGGLEVPKQAPGSVLWPTIADGVSDRDRPAFKEALNNWLTGKGEIAYNRLIFT